MNYINISMRGLLLIFVGTLCFQLVSSNYNYTCKFTFSDDSVIDLSSLQKSKPPDYTFYDKDVFYAINLCAPTIKICNGIEGSFASVWNVSTYSCIQSIGESNPIVSYIDSQNKFKGISLNYGNAIIQMACDQGYKKGALVNVVSKGEDYAKEYTFYFKSKLACGNYNYPMTDQWTGIAIFIIILLVAVFIYIGYGAYMTSRGGQYASFRDVIPQKESVMNILLKGKELINKVFNLNRSNANTENQL